MNINIIEFMVYAFVAYSSLLMLIIQASKNEQMVKSRSNTLVKSIYMIPGIICMILLAGSGPEITFTTVGNTIIDLNATTVWTEDTTHTFILQNPVWVSLHYMFALILFAYVTTQILKMLTAKD